MQQKIELNDDYLVPDSLPEIEKYSSKSELINYASTSRRHLTLFKPFTDVMKLLHHVARSNYVEIENILKNNLGLMCKRGMVTDCSGRAFEVSAFEYALWALDYYMWEIMFQCVTENEMGNEILEILFFQYNKMTTQGVTYTLNGHSFTEKHFDFENTIIKELQIQVNSLQAIVDSRAVDMQWKQRVGGVQKLLPMHAVIEYCSNMPFKPIPQFNSRPKSSKTFFNWETHQDEYWFSATSKLGSHIAIYKCGRGHAVGDDSAQGQGVGSDLNALKILFQKRVKELIHLKSQFKKWLARDIQSSALQNLDLAP